MSGRGCILGAADRDFTVQRAAADDLDAVHETRSNPCRRMLQAGQRDAALAHIFARLIGVADLRRTFAAQEEELADALARIDLGGQRRGVADLDRHLPLPFRLQRRDVDDDTAAGIGRFAQADDQNVARNAEILDGMGRARSCSAE